MKVGVQTRIGTMMPAVRQPKDKPFVERLIGSLECECLALGGIAPTVYEQQRLTALASQVALLPPPCGLKLLDSA